MPRIPENHSALSSACQGQGQLYALMDGAIVPDLEAKILAHRPVLDHMPLLLGDAMASFAPISPRLIRLTLDDELLWWLLEEGKAASWGIYLCSNADMSALYHHLYSLTAVKLDGESVQFRYYDPRVLRPFWQVLNLEEQNQLMGPIECMIVEGEQQPGFWAYQRPEELDRPPYPPTPKDWISLPEPWWTITELQHRALTESVLQQFLQRFTRYLEKKRDELRPDLTIDFHAEAYQKDLTKKAQYFMQHGFESELHMAEALECAQVFSLDLRNERVRKLVENKTMGMIDKLYTLRRMATRRSID